jgi:nicotinamidase-related amidase
VPVDLDALVQPGHTAVLTMEMQRGVVGDLSVIPELAVAVAESGMVDRIAGLIGAARGAGVRVVHCTAEFREDRAGSAANSPLLTAMLRRPSHLVAGSDAVAVLPELGPEPSDLVSPRAHGLSPFTGTSLDITLRNLGVRTVVPTGASVNLGIIGLAIEAVNLGYQVVLPTDCVTGVPSSYADDVVRYSLSLLATCTTAAEVARSWAGSPG